MVRFQQLISHVTFYNEDPCVHFEATNNKCRMHIQSLITTQVTVGAKLVAWGCVLAKNSN
jgi:hypothetical protein